MMILPYIVGCLKVDYCVDYIMNCRDSCVCRVRKLELLGFSAAGIDREGRVKEGTITCRMTDPLAAFALQNLFFS